MEIEDTSYKELVARRFIPMGRVNSHLQNIYTELHVHSKAELIRLHYAGVI